MVKVGTNISALVMKNGPDFLYFPQSFAGATSKENYLVAILGKSECIVRMGAKNSHAFYLDMDADASATPMQPHWLLLNSGYRVGDYMCQKPTGTTTNYLNWNPPVFKAEKGVTLIHAHWRSLGGTTSPQTFEPVRMSAYPYA